MAWSLRNDGYIEPKKLEEKRSLPKLSGMGEVGTTGTEREPAGKTKAEWSYRRPILGSFPSPTRDFPSVGASWILYPYYRV
jgi:hypothetical protein